MSKSRGLIPIEIAREIPAVGSQENEPDPIVRAKFFHPLSNWTWFVLEYSPDDQMCFGLVHGFEQEMGYFGLDELEGLAIGGLGVERDMYWTPRPLSQCTRASR